MSHTPAPHRESLDSPKTSQQSSAGFEPLLSEKADIETWQHSQRRRRFNHIISLWVSQLLILSASITFFIAGLGRQRLSDQQCAEQVQGSYSPAYSALEYSDIRFQGAILDTNPWKGTPNAELDEAWDLVTNQEMFSISASEMKKLKKPLTQIKWPEGKGGGYVAGLEVFHQLHCLNSLRQYSYPEYYNGSSAIFTYNPLQQRQHLDHCIDIIRQTLMCHADVGLVTQSWVKNHPNPYPDFSTWHKCSSMVPLVKFTMDRRIKGQPSRTEGSVVLETPPCERMAEEHPEVEVCPREGDVIR